MVSPSRTPEARRKRRQKRDALANANKEQATAIAATPLVLDFTDRLFDELPAKPGGVKDPEKRKKMQKSPSQIRARIRRRGTATKDELEALYKPVEEWDEEELARGRPRGPKGTFRGPRPKWITREIHEAALDRFKYIIKADIQAAGPHALAVIRQLMSDTELDNRGKFRTPASTRLQAAQLLLEHAVGKPKVMVETDISVKLQGLMANVMVGPGSNVDEDGLLSIAEAEYRKLLGGEQSALGAAQETIDAEVIEDNDDD
jgi:hypothetical protein